MKIKYRGACRTAISNAQCVIKNQNHYVLRITNYALHFKQAERKLGTSTREPDSDNADVGIED